MTPLSIPSLDRIVVAVDFSEPSLEAARWAARWLNPGGELVLLHVVQGPSEQKSGAKRFPSTEQIVDSGVASAEAGLRELAASIPIGRVRTEVRVGIADEQIVQAVIDGGAGMVVVARSNVVEQGWGRIGRTAQRVLHASPVPVLVAGAPPDSPPSRLLLAIDESTMTTPILEWAEFLQWQYSADVSVMHVVATAAAGDDSAISDAEAWLAESLEAWGFRPGTTSTVILGASSPSGAIVDEARRRRSDLIVIGTRGLGGAHRFLMGSTADAVLRNAPCPVLVIVPASRAFDLRVGMQRVAALAGARHADVETPVDDLVDEASTESFPASDPPAWGPIHAGPPPGH